MKKFISSVMAMVILVVPVSVYAMPNNNKNLTEGEPIQLVSDYQDFFKEKVCEDYSIEKVIENFDFDRIKQAISSKTNNPVDANKRRIALFESMGIRVLPATDLYSIVLNKFENIQSVHTSTQYQRIDSNGKRTIMSEDECLQEVATENMEQSQLKKLGRAISSSEPSSNGYMRQTICAIYTGTIDNKGTYVLVGQNEWLITPFTRSTDVYSLFSYDLSFLNDSNGYQNVLSYTKKFQGMLHDFTITSNNMPEIREAGCYYSSQLPPDSGVGLYYTSYSNIMTQMTTATRVKNYTNSNKQIDVTLKYVHNQLGVSVAPSWGTGGTPGVGLSVIANPKTYYKSLSFDYANDYK